MPSDDVNLWVSYDWLVPLSAAERQILNERKRSEALKRSLLRAVDKVRSQLDPAIFAKFIREYHRYYIDSLRCSERPIAPELYLREWADHHHLEPASYHDVCYDGSPCTYPSFLDF
jgi:hypothetical protein